MFWKEKPEPDRHFHKWSDESSTYNPGMPSFKGSGMSDESLKRLVFGFTVVIQRCDGCGQIKPVEFIGKR